MPMLVYLPLLWVTDRHAQIVLASVGLVVDISRVDPIAYNVMGRFGHWRRQDGSDGERAGLLSMPRLKEGIRIPGTRYVF